MITSRNNRWIKDIRRSQRRQGDGCILLEGPILVEEAVRSGWELESVLATEEFLSSSAARKLGALLPRPPLAVAAGLLGEISDVETSQGILALARRPAREPDDRESLRRAEVLLYVDGVQDPGNLGALARVAEAAGAGGLVVGSGAARPDHPRAVRASAGSLLRLPATAEDPATPLDVGSRRWVGLVAHGGRSLWEVDLDGPLAVVAGGEGAGLRPEIEARLDVGLTIPLLGPVESLNVAVATGIVLFERLRRRTAGAAAQLPTGTNRTL